MSIENKDVDVHHSQVLCPWSQVQSWPLMVTKAGTIPLVIPLLEVRYFIVYFIDLMC